ncbi:hypothetical protein ACH5RR_040771 [Cinchona calisaya]|uniref:non-specific serine/threonine protein kinase n=1 Tax=Cinchona calisaya TaxID=153742 RepID=A0ABD2XUX1_9GENT
MSLCFKTNSRHFWIVGAIIFVLIVTILLRRWAVFLEANKAEKTHVLDVQKSSKDIDVSSRRSTSSNTTSHPCSIRTYALEELRNATKDFKVQIGVGATSFVYLAELADGKLGAVKRVLEEKGGSQKIFLDEVSVLLRISHPNLVGLLGFCLDKDIARALDYLHCVADPPVIHRDVKSSNILLIDDDHAKLADFGLCKLGNDAQSAHTPTAVKGSLGYVDTNYLNTGLVSLKCDVYSFGVLLLELITGLKSVQGSTTLAEWTEECRKTENLGDLIGLLDPKLSGDVNEEQLRVLFDVANQALLQNSEARPDMSQIVFRISSCMEPAQPELPV